MIKKLLLAALLLITLIGLPLTIYLFQREQDPRSKAADATTLSLIPQPGSSSSIQKNVGDIFSVDLMVNPGNHAVSTLRVQVKYDPTKLQPVAPYYTPYFPTTPNAPSMTTITDGPVPGNDTISVSVTSGFDPTKSITLPSKVGSFSFKAIAKTPENSPTEIFFTPLTQARSSGSNDQSAQDVLGSTSPAQITIIGTDLPPVTITTTPQEKPDLVITSLELKPNPNENLCSPVGLLVTYKNQGAAITTPFAIKVNNTNPITINSLGAGQTKTQWFATYEVGSNSVTIDSASQIDETNETNNQLTQTLVVPTQPTNCSSPTDTPPIESNELSLTVFLHGIGNSGDNSNLNEHSLSNKNPQTQPRSFTVSVYNAANQEVAKKTVPLSYQTNNGNYPGIISLGTNLPEGDYIIKVKTDSFLTKRVPGFIHILPLTRTTLPPIHLVAGDINGDDLINIIDYNLLMGCYSDLTPAKACDETKKILTDLNDDGAVNNSDLNLFIRELTNQPGV